MIYQAIPLIKQSFFQKVFRQIPLENAVIEINNLLAAKAIMEISQNEVSEIVKKYKVNLTKNFPKNIDEFYAAYLNHCLKDKQLSEQEIMELKHLKELLSLTENSINNIHAKLAGAIYQKSVEEAVSDGRLDEHEKEFLNKIQSELKLPEDLVRKISAETRGNFINEFMNKAVSDERLSPEEEAEFNSMAKSLNVDVKIQEQSKAQLDKFKLYWMIENAELPEQEVDINLQKSEKCYFTTNADWYEQRTVTKRVNYGGPVASIKIMKGLHYRVGSMNVQRVTNEEWKNIDSGKVYLTNKRLIFTGAKKNSNIRLDKILSFTPYADGIEIGKETGRSPLLHTTENVDVFGLLLSRLLKES